MLKKRVIPVILIDGFSVLKTINYNERRNLGSPVTVVKTYNSRNVDELIILDIDATIQNRSIDLFTIKDIASECFMPLTVGGGIKSLIDIENCLKSGADKVCINTISYKNKEFISKAIQTFGSQCIVVSIDFIQKNKELMHYNHSTKVATNELWKEFSETIEHGAGEILFTNVSLEGMMSGINSHTLTFLEKACTFAPIPILYAGGIQSPKDFIKGGSVGLGAICASSIFHFTRYTPEDCRLEMKKNNIPVRGELS